MANPQINKYDVTKIFVFNNRYETAEYTNPTGGDVELAKGTVMGRVANTNKVLPLESTANDGSQFPIGVLADNYSVDYTESATVTICIAGDVVESKLIFENGTDTVDTVVSSQTLKDRIQGQSAGIILVGGTQLTGYDNE
jgi:hypothetical protein